VTFIIFPAVITDFRLEFLQSIKDDSLRISWTMVAFIMTFNLFDTIGRWVGGQAFGNISYPTLMILSYGRVIFIASTFLIDYDVGPSWLTGYHSDWFKLLNMALFALSNGYCSTQCAIKSPSRAPDDSKESVGTFVGVFITLGIVTGSICALGVGKLANHNLK
jgi:Nucleoside transporter